MNKIKRLAVLLLALMVPAGAFAWTDDEPTQEQQEIVVVADMAIDEQGGIIDGYPIPEELKDAVEIPALRIDPTAEKNTLELNPNLPDEVINILLIGVDSSSERMDAPDQRGDVQLIVSINTRTGTLRLTSILRDLYVVIPGYEGKNRINTAYQYGGGELAMRTINHNFEMNIEHYIVVNFYGLASIIDSLGGMDIEVTKQEAGAINAFLEHNPPAYDNQGSDYARVPLETVDGVQHLDGIQAVMYARLRTIGNDFARTTRQRNLLELMLRKVTRGGMDFSQMLRLLDTCLPYAQTNMSLADLGNVAMGVLQSGLLTRVMEGGVLLEQSSIPVDGTWKRYVTEEGASVVAFKSELRLEENAEALHEFIYGFYYPSTW